MAMTEGSQVSTRWRDIPEFPDYIVSFEGEVYNEKTRRILRPSFSNGILNVALMRGGIQYRRAVAKLVASLFCIRLHEHDNTPIHLNGDRWDCRATNLTWRPRHFAVEFHQERKEPPFPEWEGKFELIETQEKFDRPSQPAMKYGLLERHILISLTNGTAVWPTGFHFRYID